MLKVNLEAMVDIFLTVTIVNVFVQELSLIQQELHEEFVCGWARTKLGLF